MTAKTTTPGAEAPNDQADAVGHLKNVGSALNEVLLGLQGLQQLLLSLSELRHEGEVKGMVDGAAAIVGRLGLIADRQRAALGSNRKQSDNEWLGWYDLQGEEA